MEFFDWLNLPQVILQWIPQTAETAEEVVQKVFQELYISLGVAGGLYLICLIFGGLGLSTIAKKTGMKHAFLGFLPFTNTYYAGKIAGETNFFGQKMKRAGLYAMLAEIVYTALEVFLLVLNFLLNRPECYATVQSTSSPDVVYWERSFSSIPENLRWAYRAFTYCDIIAYLLWFLVLVFFCVVYFAFFRKYYARSPFLMVFLSVILPCRGFTVFAVRNNPPVDYNDYLRRRAEQYARRNPYGPGGYGGYGGGYGGQGGQSGPSGPGGTSGGGGQGEDPFSDFGSNGAPPSGGGDDPFSDF